MSETVQVVLISTGIMVGLIIFFLLVGAWRVKRKRDRDAV